MINELEKILISNSFDFYQWLETFDEFVKHEPRDSNEKLFQYRNSPDYCIWQQLDDRIVTISYRYVNVLNENGEMFCLQQYTQETFNGVRNTQVLKKSPEFPILKDIQVVKINDEDFLFTHFSSPRNRLGYPSPYNIFSIMIESNNVVEDFEAYIKRIVDAYYVLLEQCLLWKMPMYVPNHVLVSHFTDPEFYFKDSVFFKTDENLSIDKISDFWYSSIDGFRRAQGIINAYKDRNDSNQETVDKLFKKIEELSLYARNKCLSLKNV